MVNFWGAGRGKPLYSVGLFRWFNKRLAISLVFDQAGVGKKYADIESRELFSGIGFGRIYQNRRYFDAVFRGCIFDPGRSLGPIVGDLCAGPKVCVAGVVMALRVINEIEPKD